MKYTFPFLLCIFINIVPSDISGCNRATGSIMKYTFPFLLCIFINIVPSDISGCNRATGSIMKYTLPFLLCIFINRLEVTIHQIYSFKKTRKRQYRGVLAKAVNFFYTDEAKH